MKLALVTETYPPEVNGVAMTLERLVRGMAERGNRIDVVRPRQSKADAPRQDGAIAHVTVAGVPLPRYEGLRFGLPAKSALERRWKNDPPEVVHVATEGPLGVTALWAARRLGIPVSSSFHTNFQQYGKHYGYGFLSGVVMRYLRHVHNACACTIVPSEDMRRRLLADGFENVLVMARGVDTQLFDPARRSDELRRSWGAGPDDLVATYVGRVADEKNLPLAVEAFERMRAVEPGMKFVIVGDGPARPRLQRRHPEYIYAGMRRDEDLATHYASADVFVFASVTETFGNVVTEAMGSGLAVLAFDYAAPAGYIQSGVNGVTVPLGDREAMLNAAADMVRDRAKLTAMRAAARETALGMSWSAVVDRFESTLMRVAEKGLAVAE